MIPDWLIGKEWKFVERRVGDVKLDLRRVGVLQGEAGKIGSGYFQQLEVRFWLFLIVSNKIPILLYRNRPLLIGKCYFR